MNEARYYHRAAHHQELGFLITGGGWSGPKSTTEITKDGVTFEVFTPLPIGLTLHCLVALDGDDGDFFVGGGKSVSSNADKRAFIHRDNQWVEMMQMPTARHGKKPNLENQNEINWMYYRITALMCGPVRVSPGGRVEKIVAGGGKLAGSRMDKVEVYDITSNTWETGGCFWGDRENLIKGNGE